MFRNYVETLVRNVRAFVFAVAFIQPWVISEGQLYAAFYFPTLPFFLFCFSSFQSAISPIPDWNEKAEWD